MSDIFERLFNTEEPEGGAQFDQTHELNARVKKQLLTIGHTERVVREIFKDSDAETSKLRAGEIEESATFSICAGLLHDLLKMLDVNLFSVDRVVAQASLVLIATYFEEGQKLIEEEARGKQS